MDNDVSAGTCLRNHQDDCHRDRGGHAQNDYQPARRWIGLGAPGDLGIRFPHLRIDYLMRADQHRQHSASASWREGVRVRCVLKQRSGKSGKHDVMRYEVTIPDQRACTWPTHCVR
jgi:hypothetical protein